MTVVGRDASLIGPSLSAFESAMSLIATERNPERLTRLCSAAGASLSALREEHTEAWPSLIPRIRSMSGFSALQEDPFTSHSFRRPRGYPGDASLLDFVYRPDTVGSSSVSEIGRAVFRAVSARSGPRAVLNRRAMLAGKLDSLAFALGGGLRAASFACGHLREAEMMASIEVGLVEQFWAIDQEPRCVDEVRRSYANTCVRAVHWTVKDCCLGCLPEVRDLDFFYAAGLFDYLEDRLCRRLLRRMFDCLRPGGTLWVANFVPDIPDRAYMEAVMDWWLVYRTPEAMRSLDAEIDPGRVASKQVFLEGEGNVAFLELRRK